jgi:rod shape-determining protein MreD
MGLVIVGALLLQLSLVSGLPVWGAVGDVMVLVVIAAAVQSEPGRAALVGFFTGLAYDLMLGSPFGLSALVYALVGFAVASAALWVHEPGRWFNLFAAVLAGAGAMVVTTGIALLFGMSFSLAEVGRIAVVVAAWNALLILPARRVVDWASGRADDDGFWIALT